MSITTVNLYRTQITSIDDAMKSGFFNSYGEVLRTSLMMVEYFNIEPSKPAGLELKIKTCLTSDFSAKPIVSKLLRDYSGKFSKVARYCINGLFDLINVPSLTSGKKCVTFNLSQETKDGLESLCKDFNCSKAEFVRVGLLAYIHTDLEVPVGDYEGHLGSSATIPLHNYNIIKGIPDESINIFIPKLIDSAIKVVKNH